MRWRSGVLAARPLHWSTKRTSPLSLTPVSYTHLIEENAKVKAAVDYLKEVIALMGVENVTFSAVPTGEAPIIRLDGEKLGALIGRRGETMESL